MTRTLTTGTHTTTGDATTQQAAVDYTLPTAAAVVECQLLVDGFLGSPVLSIVIEITPAGGGAFSRAVDAQTITGDNTALILPPVTMDIGDRLRVLVTSDTADAVTIDHRLFDRSAMQPVVRGRRVDVDVDGQVTAANGGGGGGSTTGSVDAVGWCSDHGVFSADGDPFTVGDNTGTKSTAAIAFALSGDVTAADLTLQFTAATIQSPGTRTISVFLADTDTVPGDGVELAALTLTTDSVTIPESGYDPSPQSHTVTLSASMLTQWRAFGRSAMVVVLRGVGTAGDWSTDIDGGNDRPSILHVTNTASGGSGCGLTVDQAGQLADLHATTEAHTGTRRFTAAALALAPVASGFAVPGDPMTLTQPTIEIIATTTETRIFDDGDSTALMNAIASTVEQFILNDGDSRSTLAAIGTAVWTHATRSLTQAVETDAASRSASRADVVGLLTTQDFGDALPANFSVLSITAAGQVSATNGGSGGGGGGGSVDTDALADDIVERLRGATITIRESVSANGETLELFQGDDYTGARAKRIEIDTAVDLTGLSLVYAARRGTDTIVATAEIAGPVGEHFAMLEFPGTETEQWTIGDYAARFKIRHGGIDEEETIATGRLLVRGFDTPGT